MIEELTAYFLHLSHELPTYIPWGFLIVFCAGAVLLLAFTGVKKGLRWSAGLLLIEYMLLLLILAVFVRKVQENRIIDLSPFWSYRAIRAGNPYLLTPIIANVLAFIPIGSLLGCAFGKIRWWKVLLIGVAFSVLIETLQFVLKRGHTEVDDVMHNVLGCMIGYGIYVGVKWLWMVLRQAQEPPKSEVK